MLFKLLGLFLLSAPIEGARILCFATTPSLSHQLLPRILMKNLAERGHHVTMFTTDPFESDLPNLVQHSWHNAYEPFNNKTRNYVQMHESNMNYFEASRKVIPLAMVAIKLQLEHPAVAELLSGEEKFDVVVIEAAGATPFYAFARHFNIPLIGYTTLDPNQYVHMAVGNFIHPIAHSNPHIQRGEEMNFYQRVFSVYSELYMTFMYLPFKRQLDKYIEQYFGPDMAKSNELALDMDFLIYNNHPVFGSIRQTSPAALAVGFMHIVPPKPLTGDLEEFFQESEREIIYFSLGSNVRSVDLNKKTLDTFCNVFRKLPYNILWKWENSEMANKPENVKIVKWVPQQDVLANKKVRLFINQGGLQSIEEAVYHAVPMLVIPIANDQFRNAHVIERLGVGRQLSLKSLTPESLEFTINNLLTNETLQERAKQVAQLATDQPMTSLETSLWWIEYVIRHKGAKHLHPMSKKVPFYQFFMLDIVLAIVVAILVGHSTFWRGLSAVKKVVGSLYKYFKVYIIKC